MSIERLKFRGKVKAKKSVEMNGYTLVPNTWLTTDMISGGDHLDNVPEKIHEFWHLVDDGWIDLSTVGQWTGLVDKNGKEIYEGDVMISGVHRFTVDYFCGNWVITAQEKYGGWLHLQEMLRKPDAPTVIGTIHDEVKP